MPPTRILIVDDSVVVRKALTKIVSTDPDLEVAAVAASASIGLQKIEQCSPDILILDVEMEEMNGIEMAREVRRRWRVLPILMCSTLTARGADATVAALAAGASDYITKPQIGANTTLDVFRDELLRKIKLLTRGRAAALAPAPAVAAVRPRASRPPAVPSAPPQVLLIGCSTGGPNALAEIFGALPAPPPVPLLLVQHMPPLFTQMLAERLTKTTVVPTFEARPGMIVKPGHAYVAPGDYHMTVRRHGFDVELQLNQDAPENSCRPAVDPLFRSAALVYRNAILAGILTGMGHDGTVGARHVAEAGGRLFVQSAETCVVPSMPSSVLDAGLAAEVIPLAEIARYVTSSFQKARSAS